MSLYGREIKFKWEKFKFHSTVKPEIFMTKSTEIINRY